MRITPKHYSRWQGMKQRCSNKNHNNYKDYGGRGISVCKEWLDFAGFQGWVLATYEPGKTIDRIDNDGNYTPENCRWATLSEQNKNSRERPLGHLPMQKAALAYKHAKWGIPDKRKKKLCPRCRRRKPVEDFHRRWAQARWTQNGRCKTCDKRYQQIRQRKLARNRQASV